MKKKNKIKERKRSKPELDDRIHHRLKELEQEKIILQGLYDYLEEEKISFDKLSEIISDHLKNPIVPIKAYVDMLLEGHFGDLNDRQKEKLRIIRESTLCLNERIEDGLVSKNKKLTVFKKEI